MIKAMLTLSAYRYSPIAMKPYFWLYSGDLENITTVDADVSDKYLTDDAAFWRELKTDKLSVKEDSEGSFVFYHLRGAHDPYVMDENGDTPEGGTGGPSGWNAYPQIIGNMNMILEYIQQLKDTGKHPGDNFARSGARLRILWTSCRRSSRRRADHTVFLYERFRSIECETGLQSGHI